MFQTLAGDLFVGTVSQAVYDVTTLAQLKSVMNVDCSLTTKQRASQLKDSLVLNVFTLENFVELLNANQVNLALDFIPIVLSRVAIQAVNITSGGRIHLVGMAFDVVRRCYSLYHAREQMEKLPEVLGKGQQEPVFLFRDDYILKLMVSLVTLGRIIALGVPYTALGRLRTAGLEHLFRMTRLATGFFSVNFAE
jgi:hypothetical protein